MKRGPTDLRAGIGSLEWRGQQRAGKADRAPARALGHAATAPRCICAPLLISVRNEGKWAFSRICKAELCGLWGRATYLEYWWTMRIVLQFIQRRLATNPLTTQMCIAGAWKGVKCWLKQRKMEWKQETPEAWLKEQDGENEQWESERSQELLISKKTMKKDRSNHFRCYQQLRRLLGSMPVE